MPDHPLIPGAWNSDAVDGDEYNGGGLNWPVSPLELDAFQPLQPIVLSAALLEVFEGCPDYVVPGEPERVEFAGERELIVVQPDEPAVYMARAWFETVTIRPQVDTIMILEETVNDYTIVPEDEIFVPAGDDDTTTIAETNP